MIRFGIKEYVRNLGHNLCIILILLVMMITSAALISNLDQENRVHRLADRYMDDDSLFLSYVYNDWKEELSHIDGEVHVAEIIAGVMTLIYLLESELWSIPKKPWSFLHQDCPPVYIRTKSRRMMIPSVF